MSGASIMIRGKVYRSAEAAAKAFGITPKSVTNAVRRGRQDFIGIPAHKTRAKHGPDPFQVRIRGEVFASVRDASTRLNLDEATIRSAISRGREDFIGLGRSRKHSTSSIGRAPINAKPVRIGPHEWRSIVQCANDLGVAKSTLRDHLSAGDVTWLLARAMEYAARAEGRKARRSTGKAKAATT